MIYFISDGKSNHHFVKIGVSENNVESRLRLFQTGNAHKLQNVWEMPGGIEVERLIHRYFRCCHYRGEWFRFNGHFTEMFSILVETARYFSENFPDKTVEKISEWLNASFGWSESWCKFREDREKNKDLLNDPGREW